MDSNKRKEIEERLEKATPGPWSEDYIKRLCRPGTHEFEVDDLRLAAHAPTDIRALLSALKEAEADNAAKNDALTIMRRANNELGEALAERDAEIARLLAALMEIEGYASGKGAGYYSEAGRWKLVRELANRILEGDDEPGLCPAAKGE